MPGSKVSMKAYRIKEVKNFMGRLLGTEAFDAFLLAEASITTYNTFSPGTSMMNLFSLPMNSPNGKISVPFALI